MLRDCELINNGKWNDWRGFGMRTGKLVDCEIYGNTFREERGKGWTVWNTGGRTLRRVKVHHNTFHTHGDGTYGWNGQQPFNLEWVNVDAFDCEIYQNSFNGVVSLVDGGSPTANKPDGSVRVYGNRWDYTIHYALEAAMADMEIDHNYMHFDIDPSPDKGNGYGAILSFKSSGGDNVLIHHNVLENVPFYCIFNMTGDNVRIFNNTATTGSLTSVPGYLKSKTPSFISQSAETTRNNWKVQNNVFRCDSTRIGNFFQTGPYANPQNAVVSNNLKYNSNNGWRSTFVDQPGVNEPTTADPQFNLSGNKPDPYFAPGDGSPLINNGVAVTGITDGYSGSAPEIGAYEIQTVGGDFAAEAEDLPVIDSASPEAKPTYSFVRDCIATSWVEYTVNVPSSGTYAIKIGASEGPPRGTWKLSIDGVDQGADFDAYNSTWQITEVDRGTKTLSAGDHTFRFSVEGKNASSDSYNLGFDYLKVGAATHQAEALAVNDSARAKVNPGGMFSGGEYSFLGECLEDDFIEYTINLTAAGTYQIRVGTSAAPYRGIWQLSIDGTNHGAPYDSYSSTGQLIDVNLGSKTLSAGEHKLRFKVVGKNPSATKHNLGFDYFDLNAL